MTSYFESYNRNIDEVFSKINKGTIKMTKKNFFKNAKSAIKSYFHCQFIESTFYLVFFLKFFQKKNSLDAQIIKILLCLFLLFLRYALKSDQQSSSKTCNTIHLFFKCSLLSMLCENQKSST